MKITKLILGRKELKSKHIKALLPANIASVFSVLFSLSIVVELSNIVNGMVLALLGVFTILFLLFNERIKVKEIKNFYAGNKKAIYPAIITFLISLSLSSVGIYFWVNKTMEIQTEVSTNNITEVTQIKKDFNNQISELRTNNDFYDTHEYENLNQSLEYWKSRRPANVEERALIRENINDIEKQIYSAKESHKKELDLKISELKELQANDIEVIQTNSNNKLASINNNNNITSIFLIMILLTELGIVILNKDVARIETRFEEITNSKLANSYLIGRKVLLSLYLSANKKGTVNMLQALYSPAINKLEWEDQKKWNEVKKLYNMLINIGILSDGKVKNKNGKNVLYNNIVLSESRALKKFDEYYDKILSL